MRDFHWLAVGTQRIFAALQHLQYANSATAIRARRFSCPNTVQKMLAFSSQRFFFGKKYRVTAVLVCNGNSVSPIDTMGIEHELTIGLQVVEAGSADRFAEAFATMVGAGSQAVVVLTGPDMVSGRARLVELMTRHRLPSVYQFSYFVEGGGLVSYGPDIVAMSSRAAAYVDKILKGANPAEMPIEQPRKLLLVINRKTASMLGLTIPPGLLLQADQVIQ